MIQGQLQQAEKELLAAVEQKRRENPELPYHQALKLVASENPALNQRYTRLARLRTARSD